MTAPTVPYLPAPGTESDLAAATSARDLVPGDPASINRSADALRRWAGVLAETADGLAGLAPARWSGPAADAFRGRFAVAPQRWRTATDAFGQAAAALSTYATSLLLAQDDAADALARYRQARASTEQAAGDRQVAHPFAPSPAQVAGLPAPLLDDPGAAGRRAAVVALDDARRRVRAAATAAAGAVDAATGTAPEPAGWLQQLAESTLAAGAEAAHRARDDVLVPAVDALASLGQAVARKPSAGVEVLGGALLALASGAGDVTGAVLTATGVGAPAGVPLAAVSTTGLITGAGLVAAGATSLAAEAVRNPVQVMHATRDPGMPTGPDPGAEMGRFRDDELLATHYVKHGAEFGASSESDYQAMAGDFLARGIDEKLPTKIDADGTIRIYDESTNTLGCYNPDGTVRTLFKPSGGRAYWDRQPGRPVR